MLIFTMLFLFALARYISGTGERSPRMLLIFSLCTVLLSVSGPLTSIAMFINGETEAYNSCRLAGFTDFGFGVLAFFVAIALIFSEKTVSKEPAAVYRMPSGESGNDTPSQAKQ
jgi:EamA domain-containing membrane protein RarD